MMNSYISTWAESLSSMGNSGQIQMSMMKVCIVKSLYITILGVHRNGMFYKRIVLYKGTI